MQTIKNALALKNRSIALALAAGVTTMTFGSFVMAEGEGSEIPGMVTAALATVGLIGAAILAVYASIKIFKLVRSAL